jgi:hypothetical protein
VRGDYKLGTTDRPTAGMDILELNSSSHNRQ